MRRSAFLAIFAGACIVVTFVLVMTMGVPVPGRDIILTLAAVLFAAGFGLRIASAVAGSGDDESGDHDRTGPGAEDPRAAGYQADTSQAPAGAQGARRPDAGRLDAGRPDAAEAPVTLLGRCGNLALGIGGIVYLIGFLSLELSSREGGANIGAGIILLAAGCVLALGVACAVLAAVQRRVARRSAQPAIG